MFKSWESKWVGPIQSRKNETTILVSVSMDPEAKWKSEARHNFPDKKSAVSATEKLNVIIPVDRSKKEI